MNINENKDFPFLLVANLPRNLDCILGKDWLKENNYLLTQVKQQVLEPFSEKICTFPTCEKGIRLIEQQPLQEGFYCAASLSQCENNSFACLFACLLVNLTSEIQAIKGGPKLSKPPCHTNITLATKIKGQEKRRNSLTNNLRLDHGSRIYRHI